MKHLLFTLISLFVLAGTSIAQDEATAASLYNEGLAAMKAKDYTTAYDLMTQALAKADPEADSEVVGLANKNGAIAAYYAGTKLTKAKKFDGALALHNSGIEMNAKFYGNYVGLAKVYIGKDQTVDAVQAYLKAGEIRTAAGKADKAKSYYNNVDKIIAKAYSKKKYDETLLACDAAIAGKESAEAHYYKAKALLEKGNNDDAIAHAMKAHELGGDAKESKYVFNLAEAYESTGNKSKAVEYYKIVAKGKYYDLAQYKVNQSQ